MANFWFVVTIVDFVPYFDLDQPPQQPMQGSFKMDSNYKKLNSRKGEEARSRNPPQTHPVSSKPASVSKSVNEDASDTATGRQTVSETQEITESTGKQLTSSSRTRTPSQQQRLQGILQILYSNQNQRLMSPNYPNMNSNKTVRPYFSSLTRQLPDILHFLSCLQVHKPTQYDIYPPPRSSIYHRWCSKGWHLGAICVAP